MELRQYFGEAGRDMPFANVSIAELADADHNLTSTRASTWLTRHLIATLAAEPQRAEVRTSRAAHAATSAVCAN
jgi:hypothetical protein